MPLQHFKQQEGQISFAPNERSIRLVQDSGHGVHLDGIHRRQQPPVDSNLGVLCWYLLDLDAEAVSDMISCPPGQRLRDGCSCSRASFFHPSRCRASHSSIND